MRMFRNSVQTLRTVNFYVYVLTEKQKDRLERFKWACIIMFQIIENPYSLKQ